ncbi:MAG: right-handed parallel beta-helix repeat-containing protein [Candidatus Micrarchaeota archaeon]|nr:right-handed parallel beta-helix repeat-containing protein [Candidatus Micrarchaeota archaeon]
MKSRLQLAFLLIVFISGTHAIDVSSCGTLGAPGTYVLVKDVTAALNRNCFNVTSPDVTIDCGGHLVTGNGTAFVAGVYSNKDRTAVANCRIKSFLYGINFHGVRNGSVENTSINVSYSYTGAAGAWNTGGSYAAMRNCTITAKGASTYGTIGFSIENSTITSDGTACSSPTRLVNSKASGSSIGVSLGAMSAPYIANSNISGQWGIYSQSTNGALIENNSITTTYTIAGKYYAAVKIALGKPGIVLRMNRLVSSSGKADLVNIETSQPPLLYWNNFTNTSGLYIRAVTPPIPLHPADLNASVGGHQEGNVYYNVMSNQVQVQGNLTSIGYPQLLVGNRGTGFPYGASNSQGKLTANLVDYAPLAKNGTSAPSQQVGSLAVNAAPANGGNVTGSAYNFTVPKILPINATANSYFAFANWSKIGNCTIANASAPATTVTVYNGTCYATANFYAIGNLIVNASPANAGVGASGTVYSMIVPFTGPVISYNTPGSNYIFANWSSVGNCTIANATAGSTSVTVYSGTCYVTANFVEIGNLIVDVSPPNAGFAGNTMYNFTVPATLPLTGIGNTSYIFANWSSVGNCTIANATAGATTVTVYSGTCYVTANFIYTPPPCVCGIPLTTPNYVCNVTEDLTSSYDCFDIQANNVTILCNGHTITGGNLDGTYGIYSNQGSTAITGCDISGFRDGIYLEGANGAAIQNTSSSSSMLAGYGIYLQSSSGCSISFSNASASADQGRGILVNGGSGNAITRSSAHSDQHVAIEMFATSGGSTIANSTISTGSQYLSVGALVIAASSGNIAYGNILSSSGNASLLYLYGISGNNTFYWNNFTATSGYYVNDHNGALNHFNATINGNGEGNIYANVMGGSAQVQGNQTSSGFPQLYAGMNGTGYPYSIFKAQGKLNNVYGDDLTDYAPLTPYLYNYTQPVPGCECGYEFYPGDICILTHDLSSNGTCFNVTATNVTILCNGHSITGANSGGGTYGIFSNSNGSVIRGCNVRNFTWGIYFVKASHGSITATNTSGISAAFNGAGIYLSNSDYNEISNSSISADYGNGIELGGSSHNTITNTISSSLFSAFSLHSSGLSQPSSSFNTISNVTSLSQLIPNSMTNIYMSGGGNNTIANSTVIGGADIYLRNSNGNLLSNLSLSSMAHYGILLWGSSYNGISGITADLNASGPTLSLVLSSNNNSISDVNASSQSSNAVYMWLSPGNRLSKVAGQSGQAPALNLWQGGSNIFANSSFSSQNFSIYANASANNFFENVSSCISCGNSAQSFYSDAEQDISSDGNTGWWPLLGANGSDATTGANTAFYNGTAGGRNWDWTQNPDAHYWYAPAPAPPACVCGVNLTTPNYVCNVTQDLASTGTCFDVEAYNVTILCNGHSIIGDNASGSYGIYSNQGKTNIDGCGISNYMNGVYFQGATDGKITGTNASSSYFYGNGIILTNSASVNSIADSNGMANIGVGIYINSSTGNAITNSTGTSAMWDGIHIESSSNNIVANSKGISTRSGTGISLYLSSNNQIANFTGTSNTTAGIFIYSGAGNTVTDSNGTSNTGTGIILHTSSGNTIARSEGISSGSVSSAFGIYVTNSNSNTITYSKGDSNSDAGIYLNSGSSFNAISNSIGTSNSGNGIFLQGGNSNMIDETEGGSSSGNGIYIDSSSGNIISNSVGISSTGKGICLISSSNNTVISSNGTSPQGEGISIIVGANNTVSKSRGTSSTLPGIFLSSTAGNLVSESVGTSYSDVGIYLIDVSSSTITYSKGISSSGTGIHLSSSTGNVISGSNGTSISNVGIRLYQSAGNVVVASRGNSSSSHGIFLDSSTYNTVSNSVFTTNNSVGMTLAYNSNYNAISWIAASASLGAGVQFAGSNNNTITHSQVSGNMSGGLLLINAKNNTAADNTISGSGTYVALELYDGENMGNAFINNTMKDADTLARISNTSSKNIFYWNNFTSTCDHYVQDGNGNNIFNTTISGHGEGNIYANVMDGSAQVQGNQSSVGFPQLFVGMNGTGYPYSQSTALGKIVGNVTDYAPLTPYYLNSSGVPGPQSCVCGINLTTPNYVCNVTSDLETTTSCFDVEAYNVTILCNGHFINGPWGEIYTYGILSNADKTIAKDCNISHFGFGIYFNGTDGGKILNSTTAAYAGGVHLENSSANAISGTRGSGDVASGFSLTSGSNNNSLTDITAISGMAYALVMDFSNGNTVTRANITSGDAALQMSFSNGNSISDSTLISGSQFADARIGNSASNVVKNNTFISMGNSLLTMLLMNGQEANNTIYWNNFTHSPGYYIEDNNPQGSNFYSANVSGRLEGNIYENVMNGAVQVQGNQSSVGFPQLFIGINGTGVPYNRTTSQLMLHGSVVDLAPLTPFYFNNSSLPPQGCVCGTNLTTPNYVCNVTQDLTSNGTCFTVNATNVTIECNGHSITGSGAPGTYGIHSSKNQTKIDKCGISGYFTGIYLDGASGASITGTSAHSSDYSSAAMLIYGGSSNSISNSAANSENGAGIDIAWSMNNTISNSNGSSNNGTGISIEHCDGTLVVNSTGESTGASSDYIGIRIFAGSGSRIMNTRASSGGFVGLYIGGSPGNLVDGCLISGRYKGATNTGALVMDGADSGNTIANSTINGNGWNKAVFFGDDNGTLVNNTILNATLLLDMPYGSQGNAIYWNNFTDPASMYISDYGANTYNAAINGRQEGNIYGNVIGGSVQVQGNASSLGYPALFIGNNGTGYPYSQATSQGKIDGNAVDYAPLTPFYFGNSTPPPACVCGMNLNTPNYVCNVTQDLTSNGTCFTVNATNVTIECNGHSIAGNNASGSYGIYSNQAKTNVDSCNIGNYMNGIYFQGAANGKITGTNATSTYFYGNGIILTNNASSNIITNSKGTAITGVGIYINSSFGNAVTGSTGSSSTWDGFHIESSDNNTIANSKGISTRSGTGISLYSSSNNQIADFAAISNTTAGIFILTSAGNTISNTNGTSNYGTGIILHTSWGNTIAGSQGATNGTTTETFGIYVTNSNSNTITSSKGTSNYDAGIYLNTDSSFNAILNSTGTSRSGSGIYLSTCFSNTIANSTGTSGSGNGIYIQTSADNTIDNSNGTSNSSFGINVESGGKNTIINSRGTNTNLYGGIQIYSNVNNIINTTGTSKTGYGIVIPGSYNNVINSEGRSNSGYGLHLIENSYNNIINTKGISNTSSGIVFNGNTNYNNLTNCTGISNSSIGIIMVSSSNNIISNSAGISNTGPGIWLGPSYNNLIINTTGTSNTREGLGISQNSYGNVFSDGRISGKDSTDGALVIAVGSQGNTIANSTINGKAGAYAITLRLGANAGNYFINNTIINATNLLYLDENATGNIFYWNNFTATSGYYISDSGSGNLYNTTINGKPEGNIYANVMNGVVQVQGNVSSRNGQGLYIGMNGTGYPYNAANSQGKIAGSAVDYAPLTLPGCVCGNLATPNYVCNVTSDLASNGSCFNVQADNVTIECNGHSITGIGTGAALGVLSEMHNGTVVRNCSISGFGIAAVFNVDKDGAIYDSSLSTTDSNALIVSWSDNTTIRNVTAVSANGQGISIQNSNRTTIMNSRAVSANSQALGISNGNQGTVRDNLFTSSSPTIEAVVVAASSMVFANNTLANTNAAAQRLLYVNWGSANNTFYWNNFTEIAGHYISDPSAANAYSALVNGHLEGNIYANVMSGSAQVQGNQTSSGVPSLYIGMNGTGYPYNAASSQGKIIGGATDFAPLTPYYLNMSAGLPAPEGNNSTAGNASTGNELAIGTNALPDGFVGAKYVADLEATGGSGDYKWRANGLPDGLEIEGSRIVGVPRQEGKFPIALIVADGKEAAKSELALVVYPEEKQAPDGKPPAEQIAPPADTGVAPAADIAPAPATDPKPLPAVEPIPAPAIQPKPAPVVQPKPIPAAIAPKAEPAPAASSAPAPAAPKALPAADGAPPSAPPSAIAAD